MKRILVVDDDRLVADTLRLVFRVNGFEAHVSYSAEEGLAAARTLQPELLLTDITMPERTGIDLAGDVKREVPECRVLLLTAYSSNLEKVHEIARDHKESYVVLSKPVRPEELLRRATDLLELPKAS